MQVTDLMSNLVIEEIDLADVPRTADHTTRSSVRQPPLDHLSPPCEISVVHIEDEYTINHLIQDGTEGNVFAATAKYSLFHVSDDWEPWIRGSLMQRSSHYDVENIRNKKAGKVAIKKMPTRHNIKCISSYLHDPEVIFALKVPYHPNLVQHHDLFVDDVNYDLHIVMEHMKEDLYEFIQGIVRNFGIDRWDLKCILAQMLLAIRHVHKSGFIHCDIKPENFLISPADDYFDREPVVAKGGKKPMKYVVKLADYGHSRIMRKSRSISGSTEVGTAGLRAPELILNCQNVITPALDVWGFGLVAYELVTTFMLTKAGDGEQEIDPILDLLGTPSRDNDLEDYVPSYGYWDEAAELIEKMKPDAAKEPCIDISAYITSQRCRTLCDVIRACLQWNPSERPTADELCKMPFFKGTCADPEIRNQDMGTSKF